MLASVYLVLTKETENIKLESMISYHFNNSLTLIAFIASYSSSFNQRELDARHWEYGLLFPSYIPESK